MRRYTVEIGPTRVPAGTRVRPVGPPSAFPPGAVLSRLLGPPGEDGLHEAKRAFDVKKGAMLLAEIDLSKVMLGVAVVVSPSAAVAAPRRRRKAATGESLPLPPPPATWRSTLRRFFDGGPTRK